MSWHGKKWLWNQHLNLLARDGNICPDCGVKMIFDLEARNKTAMGIPLPDNTMTIDHIVPKSKGGENTLSNFRLVCQKCNRIKGDKPITKYRPLQEVWDYLKQENEGHKKIGHATVHGYVVKLRYRHKLKIML